MEKLLAKLIKLQEWSEEFERQESLAVVMEPKLRAAARQMQDSGVPLYVIYHYFMKAEYDSYGVLRAKLNVTNEILGVLVERNNLGSELERRGEIDQAIQLYEANIADCFNGTHPYERLRILYTRQGRYSDAVRVCESYFRMLDILDKPCALPKMQHHLDKLKLKAQQQA
ncbi:MAG: hypothetical protein QM346_19480 [Chloroflexota bacterium]|nr:hypothetical protein [Chloroflexota bacterium]